MQPLRPKAVLPRNLFGRALLILLVPIVLLQLIVGLVFFQRHYQRVTEQMTRSVARELIYGTERLDAAPDAATAAGALAEIGRPLGLSFRLDASQALAPGAKLGPLDFTGRTVVATLADEIDRPLGIDLLGDSRTVGIRIPTGKGVLAVEVPRTRLSVSNPHQLLVLMLISSIVLGAIAVAFLRNQVRPIRQLAEAAEAFGKGRSLPFRPAGAEEVRRAAGAFLSMRARIERQIEQRTTMLSGVSHDLRTPLTRMKLTLALMDDSEETAGLRQDIDQMERMLSEFLAFARGDGLEESAPTDPFLLAERLVEDSQRSGREVDLREIDESPQDRVVELRPVAVQRAVENLIGNAARHGSRVALTVRLTTRALEFVVEDDGPGIPAEDRARAVAPFSRLDAARNLDAGSGVGLGLAIALDIARSHGGSLELGASGSLGGLRATLRLPR